MATRLVVLLALAVSGCQKTVPTAAPATAPLPSVFELTGPTMGTRYSIQVVTTTAESAAELQAKVDARLAQFGRQMSTYDPESELSRFNRTDSMDPCPISRETATVVSAALELAGDSNGALDPTVGPLVNAWGFGPTRRRRVPADEELEKLRSRVGYAKLELDAKTPTLRKLDTNVQVDLNSIAQGFGVDLIAQLLDENGVSSFMVEIGGEVYARGKKPTGEAWRIGIERPDTNGEVLSKVIELDGAAITTAGDYHNFRLSPTGERLSHTIDPATGRPVTHRLAAVTVFARDCMTADGDDTVLMVLGPEKGYEWATERDIAALFVERIEDGKFRERATPAWTKSVTEYSAE